MVQVIRRENQRPKSFMESLLGGVGENIQPAIQKYQEMQQMQGENEAAKRLGVDLSGIKDPKLREKAFGEILKGEQKRKTKEYENQLRQQNVRDIENEEMNRRSNPQPQDEESFEDINPFIKKNEPDPFKKARKYEALGEHNLAGIEKEAATYGLKKDIAQKKEVTESFKENGDYITKVQDQYEDSLRKDAVFDRLVQIEESGELSPSRLVNALESLGQQPEWLQNPANEEYTKLSLDLLGGGTLQADYGSKLFASEFAVSQKRIPTLKQTPEGRRQIIEDYRTLLLPAKLKQERLQYYTDKAEREGTPLPHNLRGKVLRDIKPQLDEVYDKFKQRNGRYKVSQGTRPDDNSIEKYYYLSEGNSKKAKQMMVEDGYSIE